MHICLAVLTCRLHFWQNHRDLVRATGGNTGAERISKYESAQKVDPGEENSPAAPAGTQIFPSRVREIAHEIAQILENTV